MYAWSRGILDTLLPVAYVSLLAGLIYGFRPTERLWKLAHLRVAVGALDLGENLLIIFMLTRYLDVSARQAARRSFFMVPKGYAMSVCAALAVVLAAAAVVRRSQGEPERTP